tara:strand:+ start:467 stop:979 length:513 start_codon:yes stop_codon:yes gene_type:complete
MDKICKPNKTVSCGELKPLHEFAINKKMKDGHENRCKDCHNEYKQQRRIKDPFKHYWQTKISHSYGHAFTITPNDIPGVEVEYFISNRNKKEFRTIKYPSHCQYSGMKLNWFNAPNDEPDSPSIDRWDNNKEYVPGNVYIVTKGVNSMKGCLSVEKWEKYMKTLGWVING